MTAFGSNLERDFTVVFITQATEAKYGRFPFDRALLAQAVEQAADAGAKGVILKFFLDQSTTAEGDRRLANALSRVPVLLQARLEESEKGPNPLEDRFTLPGARFKTAVSGSSGWIPLPEFSRRAHDVCFVDFASSPAPIVEQYQNKTVKSLLVCAAELAIGHKAVIRPVKDISFDNQTAFLDSLNRVTITLHREKALATFDFNNLLNGSIPPSALRNKVVIIGYDGPSIPLVKSPIGTMGAHRLFVLMLKGFYENMHKSNVVATNASKAGRH
ncbi:CHASE2 domain-containing protein [Undibacterium sp.]|uniref:CHASE2 domain-containing protein n=1 Tax=Undibacterium sp. TaxID=1914977 RepID=UPI003750EEC6